MNIKSRTATLTFDEKAAHVKGIVTEAGHALRRRHPWLRHQDAIGALTMAAAVCAIVGTDALYFLGLIPLWVCIPFVAAYASITHEIEHDLIHWMYFRKTRWAHHLLLLLGWMTRPSTINPWIRRQVHFDHHKYSGSELDIEEKAITIGEPWGLLRLWMTADTPFTVLVHACREPDVKAKLRIVVRALAAYFPFGWLNWGAWYAFLIFHSANGLAELAGAPIAWSPATLQAFGHVDAFVVALVAPNVLRTFCLHFVSSNMHYYGDVEEGNVIQETQVLNTWWMLPFQLFCFNFGSTHAIHHFVVKEPFYVRQMTAAIAHGAMREIGVRFNDLGTFVRANRFGPTDSHSSVDYRRSATFESAAGRGVNIDR